MNQNAQFLADNAKHNKEVWYDELVNMNDLIRNPNFMVSDAADFYDAMHRKSVGGWASNMELKVGHNTLKKMIEST